MLRTTRPFELKFASDTKPGQFSGYGAVFDNIDDGGDMIAKGAFANTLAEWKTKGKMPKMLWHHGLGMSSEDLLPIGYWTAMEEDDHGLKVEGQLIALDTDRGRTLTVGDRVYLRAAPPQPFGTIARDVARAFLLYAGVDPLTGAATLRLRGKATSDVTVSPTVDTTAVSAWPATGKAAIVDWPQHLSWLSWSNSAALRYWRLDIADAANPAGYLQAGRLVLGRYWQPSINFDLGGMPLAHDQRDVQVVTDYGETFTDRRTRSAPRRFALQISAADRREVLDGIAEIQRLRGLWGDVICLLDPAATTDFHRHSMQGVFSAPQEHRIVPQFTANGEMWTVDLQLREIF